MDLRACEKIETYCGSPWTDLAALRHTPYLVIYFNKLPFSCEHRALPATFSESLATISIFSPALSQQRLETRISDGFDAVGVLIALRDDRKLHADAGSQRSGMFVFASEESAEAVEHANGRPHCQRPAEGCGD